MVVLLHSLGVEAPVTTMRDGPGMLWRSGARKVADASRRPASSISDPVRYLPLVAREAENHVTGQPEGRQSCTSEVSSGALHPVVNRRAQSRG